MSFLDQSLGFITNRTANKLRAELAQRFKAAGYDITPDQWSVLSRLLEEDGQPQHVLAQSVAKDKSNVTRIITLMQKKGLVRRDADDTDRRQLNIFITDEGRKITQQLQSIAQSVIDDAQVDLSTEDVKQTIQVLNHIYKNLS